MPITLIDKIKPANGGSFPMVDAADVALDDGSRLNGQPIVRVVPKLPDDAAEHPEILYLVVEDGDDKGGGSP